MYTGDVWKAISSTPHDELWVVKQKVAGARETTQCLRASGPTSIRTSVQIPSTHIKKLGMAAPVLSRDGPRWTDRQPGSNGKLPTQ